MLDYDSHYMVCPRCHGTGRIRCPLCQGQVNKSETCIYCKGDEKVECPKCGGNAFVRSFEDLIRMHNDFI